MSDTINDEDLSCKGICHECVGEAYLSAEFEQSCEVGACDYRGQTAPSLTIGDLVERIAAAFEDDYVRTPDQPNSWQKRLLAQLPSLSTAFLTVHQARFPLRSGPLL